MLCINRATLLGNLGGDPQLRKTATDEDMARFSMATNERWKDDQGAEQKRTVWHEIVAFGHHARAAGRFLVKGSPAYIEGKIVKREYQDGDGQTRRVVEIRVSGRDGKIVAVGASAADQAADPEEVEAGRDAEPEAAEASA